MSDETDQPASRIIDVFGGIRPMAARLDIPVSTVQGWKQRDTIPAGRMAAVRAAAEAEGFDLETDGETSRGSGETDVTAPSDATRPEQVHETSDAGASLLGKTSDPVISAPEDRQGTPARGGGIAILALLVALGVGGWFGWSTLGPGASGGDNARLSALEGRVARLAETSGDSAPAADMVAALTRDVAALRSELAGLSLPDLNSALAPLRAEIDGLRDALAVKAAGSNESGSLDTVLLLRLEVIDVELQNATQLASANMQTIAGGLQEFDIKLAALAAAQAKSRADLGARIDALEAGRSADERELSRASTLALAAGQLRTALERGAPFGGALEILKTVSGGDPQLSPALMALQGLSETGVATGPALELSFARLVPDLLAAGRIGSDGGSRDLVDRLTARFNDIVSVRRTGVDVQGDDVEARIARAEIYLADRDVAAALMEFDGLEGPAADTLGPWLARARGHVDARDALSVIEEEAITRLRADGGS
ncbi:MAG: mitofilin family membrane protein [Proteobacteria bacterium]|nr:mitofilin family membrane protein [Pseudomonadota bacterium]